ncbi:hypothetical protein RhiJN_06318 [Ceratobasidium sp. AG-Ba]|nr:hypothetical protein RhiJN_06318 [Ceratobasidium sp. AG-Ba]QRW07238.1 hypothetical protein RhiLY_06237 [Ceratobasidium sp. AG-Ba]
MKFFNFALSALCLSLVLTAPIVPAGSRVGPNPAFDGYDARLGVKKGNVPGLNIAEKMANEAAEIAGEMANVASKVAESGVELASTAAESGIDVAKTTAKTGVDTAGGTAKSAASLLGELSVAPSITGC